MAEKARTERILYKGVPATSGTCRSCGKTMIVTDIETAGTLFTYHENPVCEWYLKEWPKLLTQAGIVLK